MNLLINSFLRCIFPDTGSTRYWCVWYGKSKVLLKDVFQEFSNLMASSLNRSHKGEPVKCELNIRLAIYLLVRWANLNS